MKKWSRLERARFGDGTKDDRREIKVELGTLSVKFAQISIFANSEGYKTDLNRGSEFLVQTIKQNAFLNGEWGRERDV